MSDIKSLKLAFLNHWSLQSLKYLVLMALIIIIPIIFSDNKVSSANNFIYLISGVFIIVIASRGYANTPKSLLIFTSFGLTRKKVFDRFINDSILLLGLYIYTIGIYILMYYIIKQPSLNIHSIFNLNKIISLFLLFMLYAFIGFIIGLFKVKFCIYYLITIMSLMVLFIIDFYIKINYIYVNIGIGLLIFGMYYLNNRKIRKIKIER